MAQHVRDGSAHLHAPADARGPASRCATTAPRTKLHFRTFGKQVLCARTAAQQMARPGEQWWGAFMAELLSCAA